MGAACEVKHDDIEKVIQSNVTATIADGEKAYKAKAFRLFTWLRMGQADVQWLISAYALRRTVSSPSYIVYATSRAVAALFPTRREYGIKGV